MNHTNPRNNNKRERERENKAINLIEIQGESLMNKFQIYQIKCKTNFLKNSLKTL